MPMHPSAATAALLGFACLLTACGRQPEHDDTATSSNASTPTAALRKEIVVDPARIGPARAGGRTVGQLAKLQDGPGRMRPDCARTYRYAASWAGKLPTALPVYPGARLAEAAGSDVAGCRMRIVSFSSPDAPAKVLGFYHTHATQAGYTADREAEQADTILAGARGDAVYYLTARSLPGGGTSVDLIANHGG